MVEIVAEFPNNIPNCKHCFLFIITAAAKKILLLLLQPIRPSYFYNLSPFITSLKVISNLFHRCSALHTKAKTSRSIISSINVTLNSNDQKFTSLLFFKNNIKPVQMACFDFLSNHL